MFLSLSLKIDEKRRKIIWKFHGPDPYFPSKWNGSYKHRFNFFTFVVERRGSGDEEKEKEKKEDEDEGEDKDEIGELQSKAEVHDLLY